MLRLQFSLFFLMFILLFLKLIFYPDELALLVIIFVFNSLFLAYELVQLKIQGWKNYFSSLWNIIDIIQFILLYIVNFVYYFNKYIQEDGKYGILISVITSITILLFSLRGMSHLRIFRKFRYLINMIIEIIRDMSSFLIILIYWIIIINIIFFMLSLRGVSDHILYTAESTS